MTLSSPTSAPKAETAQAAPYLEVAGVSKTFSSGDRTVEAIRSADISIGKGEFVAVVGPSGCGKSTLLQIVAGLVTATSGTVTLGGRRVVEPPADMVYLFQQYAKSLFPWLTVAENVRFSFQHRMRLSRAAARERCREFLALVGLADFVDHYPWQLSGGMQQRVAIARALAAEPTVILMDEPFSSVDALTRLELHSLILELWARHGLTVLLVTHDVDEAVFLADKVAVLSERPSTIREVIDTRLPRPRDPVVTKEQTRFLEIRHYLLDQLLKRPGHDRR